MRYFMELGYNGAPFFGWQVQPEKETVQGCIENALSLLLREEVAVTGCGRTDTGVHAASFYAHFDVENSFTPTECERIKNQLNNFLPKDIVIFRFFPVKDTAHARFDAESRTYQYFIATKKDPFTYSQRFFYHRHLNLELMN